jgi:hypothetical protein
MGGAKQLLALSESEALIFFGEFSDDGNANAAKAIAFSVFSRAGFEETLKKCGCVRVRETA